MEVIKICKRADLTTLHTETCTQTDGTYYCSGAGYTSSNKGTTITYGNETVEEGKLNSGDAFDCDVNGDGTYDSTTERFYYVSGLNGDETSNVKVLIYYNNTSRDSNGNIQPNNTSTSLIAYYPSVNENWHGPTEAIKNLPTVNEWTNVSLTNATRAIITETGATSTTGGTLPTTFTYKNDSNVDYAARLLTSQEINSACNITIGVVTTGELDTCNYLMENTKYSAESMGTYGYWLETPRAANSYSAWYVVGSGRYVNSYVSTTNFSGVRPAIEVLESNILY